MIVFLIAVSLALSKAAIDSPSPSLSPAASTLSPPYSYDAQKGYQPEKPFEKPEMKAYNQNDAMSKVFLPSGYTQGESVRMLENIQTLNPYMLQKNAPMSFMRADKFPSDLKFTTPEVEKESGKENRVFFNADSRDHSNKPKMVKAGLPDGFSRFKESGSKFYMPSSSPYPNDGSLSKSYNLKTSFTRQMPASTDPCLTYGINCPGRPAETRYQTVKVPVYVPIPVYTYYQIPVLHHYPLNQIVRQIVPVPVPFPVEHRINRPFAVPIPVEQKLIVPQAVPYGVKVPVPVPVPIYPQGKNDGGNKEGSGGEKPKLIQNLESQFNNLLNRQTVTQPAGSISQENGQFAPGNSYMPNGFNGFSPSS